MSRRSPTAGLISEDDLLRNTLHLARLHGWRAHHCRPAQVRDGRWVTPIQGDPGFPDLVLAHGPAGRLVFAELKAQRGQASTDQRAWMQAIPDAAPQVHLWRPDAWLDGTIRRALEVTR